MYMIIKPSHYITFRYTALTILDSHVTIMHAAAEQL